MSDRKTTDVFTKLAHDALDARHNGTPPEQAEASRLTLAGKLPPRRPHVALMTETPWAEVAQVAISPEGKIAVLGIERNGTKFIKEWTVISEDWTSRVVDGTGAEMRVDHLHYPEDSEDVAYSVTRPDGKTRVFWGDWHFDASKTTGTIVGLYCDHHLGVDYCVVTYSHDGRQFVTQFRKEGVEAVVTTFRSEERIVWKELEVLGRTTKGQLIIFVTLVNQRQTMYLVVDFENDDAWRSCDDYDRILKDSVMERDGEISFVAYDNDGYIYHVGLAGHEQIREGNDRIKNAISPEGAVVDLPSGRILIQGRDGYGDHIGDTRVSLHDSHNSIDRIVLASNVRQIEITVEIPSGLVIQVIQRGQQRLLVIHENQDSVPGILEISTDGKVSNLRRWGDHILFQTGDLDRLQVICVEDLEHWLVHSDEDAYTGKVTSYPLYTQFDRFVDTEEGVLSWHFVNGTFYIFRYPLD